MVSEDILTMIEHASSVFDNINISVEDAIQLIHNAGGKAIWAHPFCVYKTVCENKYYGRRKL